MSALIGAIRRGAGLSWIELLTCRHRVPLTRLSDSESDTMRSTL